jgi:hypothetical protein
MFRFLIALAAVGLVRGTLEPAPACNAMTLLDGPCATRNDARNAPVTQQSWELRVLKAQQRWWRIYLYKLERGRWRSVGTFEDSDRDRCICFGEGWKKRKPGYRSYTGPVKFLR